MSVEEFQSAQNFYPFLTIVIAVCAILSPVITAIINNHHQKVMKQLEYKHLEHEEQVRHEREICEGYVRAAGACIHRPTGDQAKTYGENLGLILYYVPDDIRKEIMEFENKVIASGAGYVPASKMLESIAVKLRTYQQSR